ncbi:hypothetical protein GW17_00024296 [Ensete ventricosum]|uniref:Uncharacterized protein n=1 Tax=Ensete ventricosum TaxID=4639 RepID=A0A444EP05_ENSVE|nr:hypothetical protein GW17_00024296 [Ensete ventricosum]RZR72761.1 hypothetical protein BHM03_00016845 [Ensete ventricosum]
MKDICSTYSCGCLFSWPLAFVGKFLPVPTMPLGEYFGRCFNCFGKRGKLMFSVLFATLITKGVIIINDRQLQEGSGAPPQVNGS